MQVGGPPTLPQTITQSIFKYFTRSIFVTKIMGEGMLSAHTQITES